LSYIPKNKNNRRRRSSERLGRVSVASAHLNQNFDDDNAPFTCHLDATGPGYTYRQPGYNRLTHQVTAAAVDQYDPLRGPIVQRRPVGERETGRCRSEDVSVYQGEGARYQKRRPTGDAIRANFHSPILFRR